MIRPAIAFILLMKRGCQDSNVLIEINAENHLDAFFFLKNNFFGLSYRLFTAIFLIIVLLLELNT